MLSTPFICCSRGVETACERVFASAPGYVAVTRISGGTISGYCDVGSVTIDTVPTITVMIAMTMATIGLRIKNFDKVYLPADLGACDVPADCGFTICGLTGAPSRSFCRLSTITVASAGRPSSITQSLPYCGPKVTLLTWTLLSAVTV